MYTAIEKKALGMATAQLVMLSGHLNHKENWFDAYLAIDAHITEGAPLSKLLGMLPEHEEMCEDWGDIHVRIQDHAEVVAQTITECLSLAKIGMVDAAIKAELDSDVNTYDMSALVDRGAAIEGL